MHCTLQWGKIKELANVHKVRIKNGLMKTIPWPTTYEMNFTRVVFDKGTSVK